MPDKASFREGRRSVGMSQGDSRINEFGAGFEKDGITYLLIQFVDIHGARQGQARAGRDLAAAAESGAGFAGGAVWGMGQGPIPMICSPGPTWQRYTPLPYEPGVARFAADLYVDGEPHPFCPRVNLKRVLDRPTSRATFSMSASSPNFSWSTKAADGSIRGWDPHGSRRSSQSRATTSRASRPHSFLRALNDGLNSSAGASISPTTRTRISSTRSTFAIPTPDHGRPPHFLPDDGRPARPAIRGDCHLHGQTVRHRTGSGAHMHYHLARRRRPATICFSMTRILAAWVSPGWRISSSEGCSTHAPALVRGDVAHGQLLQATADGPGADRLAVGLYLDAGVHLVRRQ